jgi:hypothetical protein
MVLFDIRSNHGTKWEEEAGKSCNISSVLFKAEHF